METEPDAGIGQRLVGDIDEDLGVEGHRVTYRLRWRTPDEAPPSPTVHHLRVLAVPFGRRRVTRLSAAVDAVDELLAEPRHHCRATTVIHGEEEVDQADRRQAAEETRALEQPGVRPSTGSCQRCRDPRRAGAHDEHVRSADHRQPAGGLEPGGHGTDCGRPGVRRKLVGPSAPWLRRWVRSIQTDEQS